MSNESLSPDQKIKPPCKRHSWMVSRRQLIGNGVLVWEHLICRRCDETKKRLLK